MNAKLISRITISCCIILIVSFSVAAYLVISAPATFVVTDREETLAKIEASTSIEELKSTASALAMIGNNSTEICKVLFGVAAWTLLSFTVLSIANVIWLGRLKKAMDQR